MYKSFRVKNFRCFKDLRINDLGRVNLIAGKNNTGKTALMEAMYVLTRPLSPQFLFDIQQTRGLHTSRENRSASWKQFFRRMDTDLEINMHGVDSAINSMQRDLTISNHSVYDSNMNHLSRYLQDISQKGLLNEQSIDISGASLLLFSFALPDSPGKSQNVYMPSRQDLPIYNKVQFDQNSAYIPAQGRPSEEWVVDSFTTIDTGGELYQLIDFLREFEPDLTDLRLQSQSGETAIWGTVNNFQYPIKLMGEGMNRFCNIAISMMAENPEYLFIDEIENGIHHSVQVDIWKTIGKLAEMHKVQVFATTHSYEMIQAAHEAFKNDDPYDFRYHRLDRDIETGNVNAVTYNEFGMNALAEFNFDHEVRG